MAAQKGYPLPPPGRRFKTELYRIDFPGTVRPIGVGPETRSQPALFADGRRLHLVRSAVTRLAWEAPDPSDTPTDWWTRAEDGTDLRKVAADFVRVRAVCPSSHYGLVAVLDLWIDTALAAVELPAPPAPK